MDISHAISYIQRGWAVFPCRGKIPLTPQGFKNASTNEELVRKMFSQRPDANVAIATGAVSGFFVLDVDVKNGARGFESLQDLEKQYGKLPITVQVETWSGGKHYFFKYPNGSIGCKTNFRPGIDIRGDGGYVISPSSVIEGKAYKWINSPEDTLLAEAPGWLIELFKETRQDIDLSSNEAEITKGARNDTLTSIAGKLRRMGLNATEIEHTLLSVNQSRCNPPLPRREVERIAQSVSRYCAGTEQKQEHYSDIWSARLFYERCGEDVRYCESLGGWFVWNGQRWFRDDKFQILQLAKNTVAQMHQMALSLGDKKLKAHAIKSENEARIKAMINLVKSEQGIAVSSEKFDRDLYLVNCCNGALDLQTGELKNHCRTDYISRHLALDYCSLSECLRWRRFLMEIFSGDVELISFMQRAVGYSLSGDTSEQCIFILYGSGANGKSTFLKHLATVFGDYAMNTPAATLMEQYRDTIPNDVARLKGARFVTALESGKSRHLAEAQIKALTGGDRISARFLHREYFDFTPTFKIFLATNHRPYIAGTDEGIWRRIKLIPFERYIAPADRDPDLDKKLTEEYPGILSWVVQGFLEWKRNGLGDVPAVVSATEEYKHQADVLGQFLEENCLVGEHFRVRSSQILEVAQGWAKANGLRHVKRNDLYEYLKLKGFSRERITHGVMHGNICWVGIGLRDDKQEAVFYGE